MGLNLVRLAAKAIHINSQSGTLSGLNLARMALQAFNPGIISLNPLFNVFIRGLNYMENIQVDTLILRKIQALRFEVTMMHPDCIERAQLNQKVAKLIKLYHEAYA